MGAVVGLLGGWLMAQAPELGADPAQAEAVEVEPPPVWRFKYKERKVKVVVLAGSIGAWPKQPYAERFAAMCKNVEVRNLSKVGYGAFQLRQRFKQQFLDNPHVDLKDASLEYWLVFQGGLNSVGTPERTNHDIREMILLAHARGLKVVALSLTPWGDESDKRRWGGIGGLRYLRATRKVVDFVTGALAPPEALGEFAARRPGGAEGAWQADERPDVAVDLYRSSLRAVDAPLRDVAAMRTALEKDRTWQRHYQELDPNAREAAIQRDAEEAAEIPRWFLRSDLRSFDHIHPNTEGHRLIAETACPHLPESWGCTCPRAAAAPESDREVPPQLPTATLLLLYPHWLRVLLGATGL